MPIPDRETKWDKKVSLLGVLGLAAALLLTVLRIGLGTARANSEPRIQQDETSQRSVLADWLSDVQTDTHQVFLPFIRRDPPPITETLETKYLLVEHWGFVESSAGCASAVNSLPVYSFDPGNGVLTIYPPNPAFVLQPGDIGYIGSGASSEFHYANYLSKFQEIPHSAGGITLTTLADDGTVCLVYAGEAITLGPEATWITTTVAQPEIDTCIVTTTHRITNYAFQDRDKIVYYNLPLDKIPKK